MAERAVIDACVLYSFISRDLLLRLAERGVFAPRWSHEILDELERTLNARAVAHGGRVRALLASQFEFALASNLDRFVAAVPVDVHPKDRHVVAAAMSARANVILTFNLVDFPRSSLLELGIEVLHPDDFLDRVAADRPEDAVQVLLDQLSQLRNPPLSMGPLRRLLPKFTAAVEHLLADARGRT